MEFIILLALGIYVGYISHRVSRLENEVRSLKPGTKPAANYVEQSPQVQETAASAPVPPAADFYAAQKAVVGTPPPPPPSEPSAESQFVAWLKEDFLVKLGALLLIIAFGWFVTYAFANNWIGPIGRITFGLIVGVLVMLLGLWRIPTYKHQGGIFTALGSTIVMLTIFAAREIYDFFTPGTALLLMFMSVVFVAFVSVRYNRPGLALAGLILAGIVPFLTVPSEPSIPMLLAYLMVVVVGTLWVVRVTGSNVLTVAALLLTFLYSLMVWGEGTREDQLIGLLFAFAFTAIFFVSNIVGILARQSKSARMGQIMTAVGTGLFLMLWVAIAASDEWQSLLYVAWMLVFSSGAFVVYMHTNYRVPFYIYSAISLGLMAIATATELDGALLTTAFTIEAAGVVLVSLLLLRDVDVAQRLSLLFVAPVVLSFEHLGASEWRSGFLHEHFFAILVLAMTLMVTGLILYGAKKEGEEPPMAAPVMGVAGIVYLLMLVWLVTHSVMSDDMATLLSLVTYTVLGLTLFVRGKIGDDATRVTAGGVLLGFVVVRLLLIDVWDMDLFGRVVTFGSIGVLLISTAFIGKGKQTNVIKE